MVVSSSPSDTDRELQNTQPNTSKAEKGASRASSISEAASAGLSPQGANHQPLSSPSFEDQFSEGSESSISDHPSTPWNISVTDSDDLTYERLGYFPALSNGTLATIELILGREVAKSMAGIKAGTKEFARTLKNDRNVSLEPTEVADPEMEKLRNERSLLSKEEIGVSRFHDELWKFDVEHCKGEHEAIF